MSGFRRVYRGETDVNFPRLFRPVVAVSLVLVVVSIVSLFVSGLNLAIDFKGGAVWEVPSETLTTKQATAVLATFGKADGAKVQEVKDAKGNRIIRVQADTKDIATSEKIAQAFADRVHKDVNQIGTNTVGPSWGKEITGQALKSLIIFLIVIALYISWQLEWRMAAGALIAVIHDVVLTVGVYSVFRFEVTPATVISFLTILGYSLYDTIVVYDRIHENTAVYDRSGQYTFTAVMRRSLNQVLMRSSNTTLVSILPVISMLIIGGLAFGQDTLKDFSLALFVGLLSGAYSSIFIASPIVVYLKEREPKYVRIRKRAVERGNVDAAEWIPPAHGEKSAAAATTAKVSGSSRGSGSGAVGVLEVDQVPADKRAPSPMAVAKAAQYQRPNPPRPRKQGKRR